MNEFMKWIDRITDLVSDHRGRVKKLEDRVAFLEDVVKSFQDRIDSLENHTKDDFK